MEIVSDQTCLQQERRPPPEPGYLDEHISHEVAFILRSCVQENPCGHKCPPILSCSEPDPAHSHVCLVSPRTASNILFLYLLSEDSSYADFPTTATMCIHHRYQSFNLPQCQLLAQVRFHVSPSHHSTQMTGHHWQTRSQPRNLQINHLGHQRTHSDLWMDIPAKSAPLTLIYTHWLLRYALILTDLRQLK